MEKKKIESDINTICIKAKSFPAGVKDAHVELHKLLNNKMRSFFGISWMGKNNEIVYYAAAEELSAGEAKQYGCQTFTIKKGDYCGIMLKDWCKTPDLVSIAFKNLLNEPGLDPNGYCLEIYHGENDMECLVKLKD
ncbi:MAG: hypothetical protein UZ05_CHB002000634 [Chlorobi bacterium OLB5]|nr:MAG: hypothetical protein UZ05_CHB002000634 [Chlorobi bacterium OLB5]